MNLRLRHRGRGCLVAAWVLITAALGACARPAETPGTLVPVTRIVSVETPTPTPPPPTPTPTQTFTPTKTPTTTPVPPTATATPEPIVRFMAVGDVMLARSIGERIVAQWPGAPFAGVQETLQSAELLAINLECVIADAGEPAPKAYVFRAPPAAVEALAGAGVDVVSLANNHAYDYGVAAVDDMLPGLEERGIVPVGAGANAAAAHAPAVITRNGVRVAFLAYVDVPVEGSGFDTRTWTAGPETPGVAWAEAGRIRQDVAAARQAADVVVVMLHFGLEGRPEETASQREQARAAIDAGAALVLGAHPHVLQRTERYNGGLIAYSLGNFVFDGFGGAANQSAIFEAVLTPAGVQRYGWIPVVIEGGLPRLASEAEAGPILQQVRER
jgi:poly-gamma-glutamate synthesis protein (capsule biosynthesis protein)